MALADIIRQALDLGLAQTFVAIPGKVVSYDRTTGRAKVQPGTTRRKPASAPEDEDTYTALKEIPSVPVVWLGGGAFGIHAPIAAGDKVLLICCDNDPFPFLRTGDVSDPQDKGEHELAHAVALAGFRVPGHAASDGMTLGHNSAPLKLTSTHAEVAGNSDAAALASKLDALIHLIAVTYAPTGTGDGAALKTAVATMFPAIAGAAGPFLGLTTTGSTKLKVGG